MELAIHIAFLASAIVLLAAMARWDVLMLRKNECVGSEFLKWFRETDEAYSLKRITALAAIVVTMANFGIYVEIIVAAIILLLAVTLLSKREKTEGGAPAWQLWSVEMLPMLLLVAIVVFWGAGDIDQSMLWGARVTLLLAVLSSAFALLANRFCGGVQTPKDDKKEQTNEI